MARESKAKMSERIKRENLEADLRILEIRGKAGPPKGPVAGPFPEGVFKARGVLEVPLDLIDPDPDQPRRAFDEEALDRLGKSMQARGQIQPGRVLYDQDAKRFTIVCGERRWRAAQRVGLPHLVCVVDRSKPPREEILIDQLLENCAREDLAPLELAEALADLERRGLPRRKIAEETGLAHSTVDRSLALREQPEEVRALVGSGKLAPSTAYELRKLPAPKQAEMAQMAVERHLSREKVKEFISYAGTGSVKAPERIKISVAHGGPPGIDNGQSVANRTAPARPERIENPVAHGGPPGIVNDESDLTPEQCAMAALDAAVGGLPSEPWKPIPNNPRRKPAPALPAPAVAGKVLGAGGDLEADVWEEVAGSKGGWYGLSAQLADCTTAYFLVRSGELFEQAVRRLLASYRKSYPPEAGARVRIDWPENQTHGLEGYVHSFQPREDRRVVQLDREPDECGSVCRPFPLERIEVIADDDPPDFSGEAEPEGEEAGDGDGL